MSGAGASDITMDTVSMEALSPCIGRQCCVPHRQVLLRLLSDLLEHDSEEVRSYVHGILYSVLGVSEVKSEARAMGMEAMLKSAVSSSPPEMKSQLNYIIKQLLSNSSGNIIEGVAGDSDGEDDEEDEEDPDIIDGDEGERPTSTGGVVGEDLLMSKYFGVMTSMAPATLPVLKNLKASSCDVPLSRPVTPQTYSAKPSTLHPASKPSALAPVVNNVQTTEEAFVSRPKIPRTPEGLPPPPTPSESPPTTIHRSRPPTRSGQTFAVKK